MFLIREEVPGIGEPRRRPLPITHTVTHHSCSSYSVSYDTTHGLFYPAHHAARAAMTQAFALGLLAAASAVTRSAWRGAGAEAEAEGRPGCECEMALPVTTCRTKSRPLFFTRR